MIFLLTGCPGSGKTTTAYALMRRFERGVLISVDALREQVVSGLANPIPEWTDETTHQFALARRSAGWMARQYSDAGFAVAVEDVGGPEELKTILEPLAGLDVRKALLHPSAATCVERARTRSGKSYDPTRLCAAIPGIHAWITAQYAETHDWLRLEDSEMGLDEIADLLAKPRPEEPRSLSPRAS